MIEIGQRFVLDAGRGSVWEVAGIAKSPNGHHHAHLVSVDPSGDRKTIAVSELERGPLFQPLR